VLPQERPVRRSSVISKKLGDETVLYDQETRAIHVLNPTAILVWELCDGSHSPEDMEESLRAEFQAEGKAGVLEDVKSTIARFQAEGLLEGSRPQGK
jgi:hypothetical protein